MDYSKKLVNSVFSYKFKDEKKEIPKLNKDQTILITKIVNTFDGMNESIDQHQIDIDHLKDTIEGIKVSIFVIVIILMILIFLIIV
jgi:hypothetical protein